MTPEEHLEETQRLTVGSLFSGIGGLDLGLERAGMKVRWNCEIDPYCSRVLAKHWPTVPNLGDVTKVEWEHVERVDLICGGYPCQPFSVAGRRAGSDDVRHLWPFFAVAVRELRPDFALLENVTGHLSLGFGRVLGDLAELGYDVEWSCVSASSVGAPHQRDRVFAVAWSQHGRHVADARRGRRPDNHVRARRNAIRRRGADVAHSNRKRFAEAVASGGGASRRGWTSGRPSDCGAWRVEPDVGRVAHGVPSRVDRLRALGNAVVPQVAEFVGRALLASLKEPA